MTAPLIDLDQPPVLRAEELPVMPFRMWLDPWRRQRPAAFGIAVGAALTITALMVTLVALIVMRPAPAATQPAPKLVAGVTHHTVAVTAKGGSVANIVIYRDSTGDLVLRGSAADQILGEEPVSLSNLAAVVVTVTGPDASCEITIDGTVVDGVESSSADRGQATCVWLAD